MFNLYEHTDKFKLKQHNGQQYIFDDIRKRYVKLTPEELVRQQVVLYLTEKKGYSKALIAVEYTLKLNSTTKRCDIVVFDNEGKARIIVECKAASVKITQAVFDQIARYNIKLQVDYLIVTNGISHFCFEMDYPNNSYRQITNSDFLKVR